MNKITVKLVQTRLRKQWRWTAYANNNRKVATSGESYHNKQDCIAAMRLVFSPDTRVYQDSGSSELIGILREGRR